MIFKSSQKQKQDTFRKEEAKETSQPAKGGSSMYRNQ